MQRMEKEHNRREDMLRQEISDLQVVSLLLSNIRFTSGESSKKYQIYKW